MRHGRVVVAAGTWKTHTRRGGKHRRNPQATNRDTPPKDVCAAGRSPGSRVRAPARPSRRPAPVTTFGRRLAAYSCGGSSGIALPIGEERTGFPLSFRQSAGRTYDGPILRLPAPGVKKDIKILLYTHTNMHFGVMGWHGYGRNGVESTWRVASAGSRPRSWKRLAMAACLLRSAINPSPHPGKNTGKAALALREPDC